MHILGAILLIVVAAGAWLLRGQRAARGARDLIDVAADAQAAARRFRFRWESDRHPVEALEDSRLAAAGLLAAIGEMAGPLTQEQVAALAAACGRTFGAGSAESRDYAAFGRWIAGQCGSPDEAARRLTRATLRLAGPEGGSDLLAMAQAVVAAGGAPATDRQTEAMTRIARDFGVGVAAARQR